MDYSGKNILIFGAGLSGIGAARFLSRRPHGRIILADDSPLENLNESAIAPLGDCGVEFLLGNAAEGVLSRIDLVVISPGIPLIHPIVLAASEKGIAVIGEFELGMREAKSPVIAITGTNGKTTTVRLIEAIVNRSAEYCCDVVGNINRPITDYVDVVEASEKKHLFIAELSSFQLETIESFKPKIAAILNMTPDHLDRYRGFSQYVDAKVRITENQDEGDCFILNYDDSHCRNVAEKSRAEVCFFSRKSQVEKGIYLRDGQIVFSRGTEYPAQYICDVSDIQLVGDHNIENVLAGVAAACLLEIDPRTIADAIRMFCGVEHRIEYVTKRQRVTYFNDSKSTNVDSLRRALLSFDQPIVLIAGGVAKGLDFVPLAKIVGKKVNKLILIGEAKQKMKDAWGDAVEWTFAESMEEAVELAQHSAQDGDVVLLSPACASFDMFENYKERGAIFKRTVLELT